MRVDLTRDMHWKLEQILHPAIQRPAGVRHQGNHVADLTSAGVKRQLN
jgi:hypothetical protein